MYHVLLEGRRMGPYDRRTIVGMRIRKALTSAHVLIGSRGEQLTVGALFEQRRNVPFEPERTGSRSVVQAAFTAALHEVEGSGLRVPKYRGEMEVRVQRTALRFTGAEGRVRIPIQDVAHTRLRGSVVDLWLRGPAGVRLQRISLDLLSDALATDLVGLLPDATPYPAEAARAERAAKSSLGVVIAVAGVVLAMLGVLLVMVMTRS